MRGEFLEQGFAQMVQRSHPAVAVCVLRGDVSGEFRRILVAHPLIRIVEHIPVFNPPVGLLLGVRRVVAGAQA